MIIQKLSRTLDQTGFEVYFDHSLERVRSPVSNVPVFVKCSENQIICQNNENVSIGGKQLSFESQRNHLVV